MENWIKPGESVTSVQKKIKKPDLSITESDSKNNDDNVDNENEHIKNTIQKEQIGPLEMDETHNGHIQKMDVNILDNVNTSPKTNESVNVLVKDDETMQED